MPSRSFNTQVVDQLFSYRCSVRQWSSNSTTNSLASVYTNV